MSCFLHVNGMLKAIFNPLYQSSCSCFGRVYKQKIPAAEKLISYHEETPLWALRDSNPRPSACKADALNQLS